TVMVRSPSLVMSTAARKERPIRRWISWVRPPIRPWMASREPRSWVARGSIEYSAVTQPDPVPRRWPGTRSSTDAVTFTRVRPNSTTQDPSAWTLVPSWIRTGRSWSGARPSCRAMPATGTTRSGLGGLDGFLLGFGLGLSRGARRRLRVAGAGHRGVRLLLLGRAGEVVLQLGRSLAKLLDRTADGAPDLGKLAGTEDDQHDDQDQDERPMAQ